MLVRRAIRLRPRCLLTGQPGCVLCAAGVGLMSLTIYLLTLAPGLTWAHDSADGGELAAAARILGIPHPPGYPTYVLLAHLFTLLPAGEVATRTNLLSAVCAATAAAVLTHSLARRGRPAAVSAGLALALSPLLWSQATVTEVHALNGLFTVLLLAAATSGRAGRMAATLAAVVGLAWGLSLGNHPTALFCVPLVIHALCRGTGRQRDADRLSQPLESRLQPGDNGITEALHDAEDPDGPTCPVASRQPLESRLQPGDDGITEAPHDAEDAAADPRGQGFSRMPSPKHRTLRPLSPWASAIAGLALGLSVYAYLPLRAVAGPPINWGDPRTGARFWWVVSGTPYRHFMFALPLVHLPVRLLAWMNLLRRQFSLAGLLVALVGAAGLWSADRGLLLASGATVVLCSVFALGYNTSDSYLYLVPALVCLGLWLGSGVNRILTAVAKRGPRMVRIVAAVAVALPLALGASRFSALDLSGDRTASEFGATVLGQAPPNAVILTQQDGHTFALWYAQYAEGHRPDVAVVDRGLLGYNWYAAQLAVRLGTPLQDGEADPTQTVTELGLPVCEVAAGGMGLACTAP